MVKRKSIRKKRTGLKIILFLTLCLLIAVISLISYFQLEIKDLMSFDFFDAIKEKQAVNDNNETGLIFNVAYDINEDPVFAVSGEGIIQCTAQWTRMVDLDGNEQWFLPLEIGNPLIQARDNLLLVADIGGHSLILVDDGQIKWEKNLNFIIRNVSFNGKYITVVGTSEIKGYRGTMSLFAVDGREIVIRNIAEYIPYASTVISFEESEILVINGINTTGLHVGSVFEFYNDFKEEPVSSIFKENELYPSVNQTDDGGIVITGEQNLMYINNNLEPVWDKSDELKESLAASSDVCDGEYIVIAALDKYQYQQFKRGKSIVYLYDRKGNEIWKYDIDTAVKKITSFGNVIAIAADREIFFKDSKGQDLYSFSTMSDIKDVFFVHKHKAVVITDIDVSVIGW